MSSSSGRGSVWSAPSDEKGEVSLGGIPGGDYTLRFERDRERLGVLSVSVAPESEATVRFTIPPSIRITGAVLLGAIAATSGSVQVTRLDNRLSYSARVAPSGSYDVTVYGAGKYRFFYGPGMRMVSDPRDGVRSRIV